MIFGRHINKYYFKYLLRYAIGLIALICVDYFQLIIPEIYRMVIDGVNNGFVIARDANFMLQLTNDTYTFDLPFVLEHVCKPMFFVVVIIIIGRFLWRVCFFGAGINVAKDLRLRMFDHCKNLPLEFYSKNKIGDLMSLFTNDLDTIDEGMGWGVLMMGDVLFLGGMSLYKMVKMNWQMALLCLIPLAFMFTIGLILGKKITQKWDARQQAYSNLSDFSQESFSGIAVIKAFVKELKELLAFKKLNNENENANVNYTKVSTLLNILITLLVESVLCIILGFGGYLVYQKIFTAGQLMEFAGYFESIVWPIMAITELIDMGSRGKASLKRIGDLLDEKNNVCDKDTATEIQPVKGSIEFRNLTFRYPQGDYNALENASFVINAGESVGIVGKTGSGKTTLADLILRCYNVTDGSLFVDGQDVNDVTINSLRNYCAYVPQDNFLFSDTIANNISFASDNSDMESIMNSAKLADVHVNIQGFGKHYDTVLGERGVTVSGGQKQRISIARALMKDAPILILDDSVSAVDTDTEKTILTNLKQVRQGKTTILIAHRISTVQGLDKIIYLDNGKVLDVGTHDQLVSRCKDYATLVKMQELEQEQGGEQ